MIQTVLNFNAGTMSALRTGPDQLAAEVKTAAVVQWYAEGRISQRQAAEILGISRARFLDLGPSQRVGVAQEQQRVPRAYLTRSVAARLQRPPWIGRCGRRSARPACPNRCEVKSGPPIGGSPGTASYSRLFQCRGLRLACITATTTTCGPSAR